MTPFEKGWVAAETGARVADCPYHRATGEAVAWRAGFSAMLGSVGL